MAARSTVTKFLVVAGVLAAAMVCLTPAEAAAPKKIGVKAFGKTLGEWMALHVGRSLWAAVGVEKPDQVGNVKLMPIPEGEYQGGAGTADDPAIFEGQLDVTLRRGTAFVLPVTGWIGWTYPPEWGIPDDPPLPLSTFSGTVSVDGRPVTVSYFEPTYFAEPIPLPFPYTGCYSIYIQGLGVVHEPLSVGCHTMELESSFIWVEGNWGTRYINTWDITVVP